MKMLFLAPVLACSLAFSADVIAKDANITLDGKMIGKIEVLTPVEVGYLESTRLNSIHT